MLGLAVAGSVTIGWLHEITRRPRIELLTDPAIHGDQRPVGLAITHDWLRLDKAALRPDARALSALTAWTEPSQALATVDALLCAVGDDPTMVDDAAEVSEALTRLRGAVEDAQARNARVRLVLL